MTMENTVENNQKAKGCPHDCRKCGFQQHAYCAAQMALNSFPALDAILSRLDELSNDISELKAGKEYATPEPKMHSDDGGAENRPSIVELKDD